MIRLVLSDVLINHELDDFIFVVPLKVTDARISAAFEQSGLLRWALRTRDHLACIGFNLLLNIAQPPHLIDEPASLFV